MLRGAIAAALFLAFATDAHADLGRDDQWAYVPANAERGAMAELRGDGPQGVPSLLIIQIECERSARALIFHYDLTPFLGDIDPRELAPPMGLVLDLDRELPMATRRTGNTLRGRLPLNAENVDAIAAASAFHIYAPNGSGDPWVAGRAPALKRVTRECWERSVR